MKSNWIDLTPFHSEVKNFAKDNFTLVFPTRTLEKEAEEHFLNVIKPIIEGIEFPVASDSMGRLNKKLERAKKIVDIPSNPQTIGSIKVKSVLFKSLLFDNNKLVLKGLEIQASVLDKKGNEALTVCKFNPIPYYPEVLSYDAQFESDLKGLAENTRAIVSITTEKEIEYKFSLDKSKIPDDSINDPVFKLIENESARTELFKTFSKELLEGFVLIQDLDGLCPGIKLGANLDVLFKEFHTPEPDIFLTVIAPDARAFINSCPALDFSSSFSQAGGGRGENLVSEFAFMPPAEFQTVEIQKRIFGSEFITLMPKKFLDYSFSSRLFDIGLEKLQPAFGVSKRGKELGGALRWRLSGSVALESISGDFIFQGGVPQVKINFTGYSSFQAWSWLKVGSITYTLATMNAGHENLDIEIILKPWYNPSTNKLYFVVEVGRIVAKKLMVDVDIRLSNFAAKVDFFIDLILSLIVKFFGKKEFAALVSTLSRILTVEIFDVNSLYSKQSTLNVTGMNSEYDSWLILIGGDSSST